MNSGSTLQSLKALSVGEAEFCAVVKGVQVGLTLRPKIMDLGTSRKVDMQSGSSTSNFLTDRLGAGPRTKHIDSGYFWVQQRVQEGDLSEKLCRCWNEASLCFCTTANIASLQDWYSTDHGSHTPLQGAPGIAHLLKRADVGGAEQTIVITGHEHRDGCKNK